ncbi:hypothetical protein HOLleu_43058 [Holothuria leucospilota]|uniref:Uncharacterized protein n=1 Tax=Holothuria leucospilota TaxID=206669 RepID=A0A9Q1B957_HOLLE|nr:hypothetical protein HOLleu_43058 [Holothuria leucospilota]
MNATSSRSHAISRTVKKRRQVRKGTLLPYSKSSAGRTTGATAMNSTSSRSHPIFTIQDERKEDRLVNFISTDSEEVELGATFLLYSFFPKVCYE